MMLRCRVLAPTSRFLHTPYSTALRLNPDHRGAHEYIGEAYLMVKNLAKAEEHLRVLDRLCKLPREEKIDLQKAVETYKAARERGDTLNRRRQR